MKFQKKVSDGVGFARKEAYDYDGKHYEADIKNEDTVTLLNGGVEEEGNYGTQYNFKISTRNGDKKVAFNQKSINVLVDEFGDDSANWVGKELKVLLNKTVIGGKKVAVAYFVTENCGLDEYGDLVVGHKDEHKIDLSGDVPSVDDVAF